MFPYSPQILAPLRLLKDTREDARNTKKFLDGVRGAFEVEVTNLEEDLRIEVDRKLNASRKKDDLEASQADILSRLEKRFDREMLGIKGEVDRIVRRYPRKQPRSSTWQRAKTQLGNAWYHVFVEDSFVAVRTSLDTLRSVNNEMDSIWKSSRHHARHIAATDEISPPPAYAPALEKPALIVDVANALGGIKIAHDRETAGAAADTTKPSDSVSTSSPGSAKVLIMDMPAIVAGIEEMAEQYDLSAASVRPSETDQGGQLAITDQQRKNTQCLPLLTTLAALGQHGNTKDLGRELLTLFEAVDAMPPPLRPSWLTSGAVEPSVDPVLELPSPALHTLEAVPKAATSALSPGKQLGLGIGAVSAASVGALGSTTASAFAASASWQGMKAARCTLELGEENGRIQRDLWEIQKKSAEAEECRKTTRSDLEERKLSAEVEKLEHEVRKLKAEADLAEKKLADEMASVKRVTAPKATPDKFIVGPTYSPVDAPTDPSHVLLTNALSASSFTKKRSRAPEDAGEGADGPSPSSGIQCGLDSEPSAKAAVTVGEGALPESELSCEENAQNNPAAELDPVLAPVLPAGAKSLIKWVVRFCSRMSSPSDLGYEETGSFPMKHLQHRGEASRSSAERTMSDTSTTTGTDDPTEHDHDEPSSPNEAKGT